MRKNKLISFIMIFILCAFCFSPIITYGATNTTAYNISTDRGPRISLELSNSNKVILNAIDNGGIKSVKVEKYSNSKWRNITSKVSISKDKKKISISSKVISKGITIRVTTTDKSKIAKYSKDVIKITKLSKKDSAGNYFSANISPKISVISVPCKNKKSIDSLVIKASDQDKIKSYSIEDMNNKKKKYKYNVSDKQESYYITFPLKKLKYKNSRYYIILNVTDSKNNTHTEKMSFSIKEKSGQASIKYLAHRGASNLAPENTIKSFELAGKAKAFGIETDIQCTSDGELVCMHDATVDRTTNGKGKVSDISLESIKKLKIDAGSNVKKYNNLSVPTFTEYIEICKKYDCYAIIELKKTLTQDSVKKVLDIIKLENIQDKCLIISFDEEVLNTIRENDTSIKIGYLVKSVSQDDIDKAINYKNCAICPKAISEDLAKYAHKNGVQINVWTADKYAQKAILHDTGVDYITTNILDM